MLGIDGQTKYKIYATRFCYPQSRNIQIHGIRTPLNDITVEIYKTVISTR